MLAIFAIALGGAFGALGRYFTVSGLSHLTFASIPIGILSVNIVGSFLMGIFVALFMQVWSPSQELKFFIMTGFLGSFTTFSAFSYDVFEFIQRSAYIEALLYMLSSVLLSIMALFLGHALITYVAKI